jgi:hypothetical protein
LKATEEIETSFYRAGAAAVHPAQKAKDTEATMNAKQNRKSGSSIEEQLRSIQMSEVERQAALNVAGVAELFADAIMWVCNQAQRVGAGVFAKPSPKY